jgi:hypothetical protein
VWPPCAGPATHEETHAEAQLEGVRAQRMVLERAAAQDALYEQRHVCASVPPPLSALQHSSAATGGGCRLLASGALAPEMARVLARPGGIGPHHSAAFLSLLEQEDEEGFVFSFPLLAPEFCAQLVREADSFRAFQREQQQRPAGAGAISISSALARMGLGWVDEELLRYVVGPAAALLYPQQHGGGGDQGGSGGGGGGPAPASSRLDWCHGYVASYSGGPAGAGGGGGVAGDVAASSSRSSSSSTPVRSAAHRDSLSKREWQQTRRSA